MFLCRGRYVGALGCYHHWMDPNLADFLHLGYRFYEPEVGRFTQIDPMRDGLNWYAYVENDPTLAVDPDGLIAIVNPRAYQICEGKARRGKATTFRYGRWIRQEKHYNLLFTACIIHKCGLSVLTVSLCAFAATRPGVGDPVNVFIQCIGAHQPSIIGDLDQTYGGIKECFTDSRYYDLVEAEYIVNACQLYGSTTTFLDKAPPLGGGWKKD